MKQKLFLSVTLLMIIIFILTSCRKDGGQETVEPFETKQLIVSPCYGTPKKNVYCLQVYDPVCGCDGKTYGNACEAGRAGIKMYTQGACGGGNSSF